MTERLIVRLPEAVMPEAAWQAGIAIAWVTVNEQGHLLEQGEQLDPEQAMGLARGKQLIALAPASSVTLHQVAPPAGGRRNLLQALPYLLEEELAGDVETLQFALGPQLMSAEHSLADGDKEPAKHKNRASGRGRAKESQQQAVAVVSRQLLSSWQSGLQALGLTARYIVPEQLCLPLPVENRASSSESRDSEQQTAPCRLMVMGEQWLVRSGPWQGTLLEPGWAQAWAGAQQVTLPQPQPATVLQGLRQLAAEIPATPFTLLQGDFRPRRQMGKQWLAWRGVALAASLVLVMQLVLDYQQLSQLRSARLQYHQAAEQIYRSLFGAQSRIVNLPVQMRQQLQALQGGERASQGFLDLMLSLAPDLAAGADLTITGISFDARRNELKLDAAADEFTGFEQFAARLSAAAGGERQLSVEQGALKRDRQGKINGTLTVRQVR